MKKEEKEELINERLNQIYKQKVKSENFKKIKLEEMKLGIMLEKTLKEKDMNCFKKYCEYEEIQSEYVSMLFKEYYEQGLNDGINLILGAK